MSSSPQRQRVVDPVANSRYVKQMRILMHADQKSDSCVLDQGKLLLRVSLLQRSKTFRPCPRGRSFSLLRSYRSSQHRPAPNAQSVLKQSRLISSKCALTSTFSTQSALDFGLKVTRSVIDDVPTARSVFFGQIRLLSFLRSNSIPGPLMQTTT